MPDYTLKELYDWCAVPYLDLASHPQRKIPFRLCADSAEMGRLMARELVDEILSFGVRGQGMRVILPCGPYAWERPFTELVNRERIDLRHLTVFMMDECLDWQGRLLPERHPYNFRAHMQQFVFGKIDPALAVPADQIFFLSPASATEIERRIAEAPIDLIYGGWGQDGHVAYNQARRHPYSPVTVDDFRQGSIRIQENNYDTLIACAQRSFGSAYQFVPPLSITLGLSQILPARKIRLFSDTGAWKQTALRVALFGPLTPEYPMTLLQQHPDALLTATVDTARHPISEHPEWDLGV